MCCEPIGHVLVSRRRLCCQEADVLSKEWCVCALPSRRLVEGRLARQTPGGSTPRCRNTAHARHSLAGLHNPNLAPLSSIGWPESLSSEA